ncbi:hypothetical protein [Nocardia thailandica]|uniref:hypothetical protein n=1 Tax=Nocardia thailandica TaxID=257275 RepID=UPI00031D20CE|nr:hypothetical protein [Nocardia thailandica]
MSVTVADTGAAAWTEDNVLIVDSPLADLAPGHRVDDFDLLTALHTGERSRVFLARQRSMQRVVALRFVLGEAARPAAELDHPSIVRVFDHRPVRLGGADAMMVHSQYLPGGTAREIPAAPGDPDDGGRRLLRAVDAAMESRGEIRPADSRVRAEIAALSWPETVARVGAELASALAYADRNGVRHGAITAGDVLFTAEGIAKLGGFTGPDADPAADVEALARLLWRMLTGAEPGADREPPADCPPALARILVRCMGSGDRPDAATLARRLTLCLDPRARDLVDPPPIAPRVRLRRWRLPLVALAVMVPNALASLYEIKQSNTLVMAQFSDETRAYFAASTAVSNPLSFALGAALLLYLSRHVVTVPGALRRGGPVTPDVLARARAEALLLGDRTVAVVLVLWIVSALTVPFGMWAGHEWMSLADFAHILAAHLICATIALAYPFLLVTFFMVRSVYPMFLGDNRIGADEVVRLRALRRRCTVYLLLAASIPLFAVASATLLPTGDLTRIIGAVRVLALGSVVLFAGAYLVFRALERDLRALERVGSGQE